ncbi:unnamed protein product [Parascedosporium putredinis]|uniref:Uncharacterized protein n=1 Tax=Parascedosporium putredinis TaxID=1442378 RepID=A0A9P1M8X1_9PEZI|nr:unnamed protein product [Parascedosporium putredinis]CAI7993566.1 unnamed protein product [Parascedosporium putredinis]
MKLTATLAFAGAATASVPLIAGHREALMALEGVLNRRADICIPVPEPATCEKSCGPGNIPCIGFPTCYNPSQGESCCSDGTYCPAGTRCTDAGCCPNDRDLADCGASITLSVIPPPATGTPEEPTDGGSEETSYPEETPTEAPEEPSNPTEPCHEETPTPTTTEVPEEPCGCEEETPVPPISEGEEPTGEPTGPEPSDEPTIPEPTVPEPTLPEPTVPEPTIPEPSIPEPTLPGPSGNSTPPIPTAAANHHAPMGIMAFFGALLIAV